MNRKLLFAGIAFAGAVNLAGHAFAGANDYVFEPVKAEVKTGEWLMLHARRRTGPWTEVDRQSLGPNGCWVGSAPPAEEPEVATELIWRADPPIAGQFDDGLRADKVRRVRFSAPGRYVLQATSATWCSPKADSNTLVIVVRP